MIDKDTKIVIKTIFLMFKKLEDKLSMLNRDMQVINKT